MRILRGMTTSIEEEHQAGERETDPCEEDPDISLADCQSSASGRETTATPFHLGAADDGPFVRMSFLKVTEG